MIDNLVILTVHVHPSGFVRRITYTSRHPLKQELYHLDDQVFSAFENTIQNVVVNVGNTGATEALHHALDAMTFMHHARATSRLEVRYRIGTMYGVFTPEETWLEGRRVEHDNAYWTPFGTEDGSTME